MEIKIDIISGFLGAGKTSLIKKIITTKFTKEKIAIIENEFGEISIDTDIFRDVNVNIKEITSGCICCSLVGDFKDSVKSIIELYSPQRILIEPSGVAKLSDVIKACENLNDNFNIKINMLITVLDLSNAQMYIKNFGEFFIDQIKNAKILVLSRKDLISEEKFKDTLNEIKKINSQALILTESLDKLNFNENFLETINNKKYNKTLMNTLNNNKKQFIKYKLVPKNNLYTNNYIKNEKNNSSKKFSSWSLQTNLKFNKFQLNNLIEEIIKDKSYGLILRCKGIVELNTKNWLEFHYVPGKLSITDTSKNKSGKICIIGTDINKSKLTNLFTL